MRLMDCHGGHRPDTEHWNRDLRSQGGNGQAAPIDDDVTGKDGDVFVLSTGMMASPDGGDT